MAGYPLAERLCRLHDGGVDVVAVDELFDVKMYV